MLRAIDLDQLADMLAAIARLLDPLAFRPRYPDASLAHPATQRLSGNSQVMTSEQLLGSQCRTKVRIKLAHQSDRMIANRVRKPVVRGTTAALVGDR
jgi:hypothetical protein